MSAMSMQASLKSRASVLQKAPWSSNCKVFSALHNQPVSGSQGHILEKLLRLLTYIISLPLGI